MKNVLVYIEILAIKRSIDGVVQIFFSSLQAQEKPGGVTATGGFFFKNGICSF